MNEDIRKSALASAIDYHSRLAAPWPARPTDDEIIATAEKFAVFLLVNKKAQQPRAAGR